MTVFRWNSLQDLFAIQEKVNRLFEETIHRTEFPDDGLDTALWSPAADVYETPEEIILNIELPGVRLDDVRLEALDGKLRVSGHRRADDGVEPRHFVRMERIYGTLLPRLPGAGVARPGSDQGDPAGRACCGSWRPKPSGASRSRSSRGRRGEVGRGRTGRLPDRRDRRAVRNPSADPADVRAGGAAAPGADRGQHPPLRLRHHRAARDHPDADPASGRQPRRRGGHPPHEAAHGDACTGTSRRCSKSCGRSSRPAGPARDRTDDPGAGQDSGPAVRHRPVRAVASGAAGRPPSAVCPRPPYRIPRSDEPFGRLCEKVVFALAGLAIAASALAELTKYKDWDRVAGCVLPDARGARPSGRTLTTDEDAEKFIALYWAKRGGEPFKQESLAAHRGGRPAVQDAPDTSGERTRSAATCSSSLGAAVARRAVARAGWRRSTAPRGDDPAASDTAVSGDATLGGDRSTPGPTDKDKFAARARPRGADAPRSRSIRERGPTSFATAHRSRRPWRRSRRSRSSTPTRRSRPRLAAARGRSASRHGPRRLRRQRPRRPRRLRPRRCRFRPPSRRPCEVVAERRVTGEAGFWSGIFRSVDRRSTSSRLQFYLPSNKPAFASATLPEVRRRRDRRRGKGSRVVLGGRHVLGGHRGHPQGSRLRPVRLAAARQLQGHVRRCSRRRVSRRVASASVPFKLEPKSTDFEVSPLILSSGLVPLTKRPGPTDPFVFGTEKPIKVEPKGDRVFSKQDSLWYFYAVDQPVVPAPRPMPPALRLPRRRRRRAPRRLPGGSGRRAQAARHDPNQRAAGRPGRLRAVHGAGGSQAISGGLYGTGSEIPLASFEPGYYTFVILVRDLNAPARLGRQQGHRAQGGLHRADARRQPAAQEGGGARAARRRSRRTSASSRA